MITSRNTPDSLSQASLAKITGIYALAPLVGSIRTVGELMKLLDETFFLCFVPAEKFVPDELKGVLGRELVGTEKLSKEDNLNVLKYLLKRTATSLHLSRAGIYDSSVHTFTTKAGSESIELTSTTSFSGNLAWQHTDPTSMLKVMQEIVPQLTQKILDPSTPSAESLEVLSDLHWHLAHAMPYERGSALIADWYIDSLARAKGIELSGWARGVVPDLEALTLPRRIFMQRYPSLFVRPPVLPANDTMR